MKTKVVIGASLAGGRAVEAMRKEGFDGRIVLVGAESERPYERPPLSKEVLRKETDRESVFLRPEDWYGENEVELRLGVRATSLDPRGEVELSNGETIAFESCLVATGGRVRTLSVPGSELEGVCYLRTLEDATALASALAGRPRVVVVGAGFIGAEVAASARMLGCEVTMIELLAVPLERVLGIDLGNLYADIHRDHGTDVRLGEAVKRIEGSRRAEAVVGASGTRYPADLVVVGVGIVPNTEVAEAAGLDCRDGIVVDASCRTSAPKVFAAGDVARRPDVYSQSSLRLEHFQNAQNQGAAAGRAMCGADVDFQEVPWFWSDQYDTNLQMLGHPPQGAEPVIRGSFAARELVALYLDGEKLLAAIALNRPRDVAVLRRLIERAIPVDAGRLADEAVDLKDLLRA